MSSNDEPFFKDEDSDLFHPEEDLAFDENQDFFPDNYDLEKVFDESISPLLNIIMNMCSEYGIPMVATFQYKNTDDKVHLCTNSNTPTGRTSLKLKAVMKTLLN